MGNFFGFRRRRENTRSVSGIDGSFKFLRGNAAVEEQSFGKTARSMSSGMEKGGASHAPSASSTAPKSKSNKYTFIPDNFSTIDEVTSFFFFFFFFFFQF